LLCNVADSVVLVAVLDGTGARDGTMATLTARTASGALLGHVTMTYEADVTGDVAQIHSRQLDAACGLMLSQHSSFITPPLLDTVLTGAIFDDAGSSLHNMPPRAFELLFESAKYVALGNSTSRLVDDIDLRLADVPNHSVLVYVCILNFSIIFNTVWLEYYFLVLLLLYAMVILSLIT